MALDWMDVNWLAVIVAGVAHMVLGMAWFGVFAKPWTRAAYGMTVEEFKKRAPPPGASAGLGYAVAALGGLAGAYVLAVLLNGLAITTLGTALGFTFALWVAFVALKYATSYMFQQRPGVLIAIDSGYFLVGMLIAAAVLVLWP